MSIYHLRDLLSDLRRIGETRAADVLEHTEELSLASVMAQDVFQRHYANLKALLPKHLRNRRTRVCCWSSALTGLSDNSPSTASDSDGPTPAALPYLGAAAPVYEKTACCKV